MIDILTLFENVTPKEFPDYINQSRFVFLLFPPLPLFH